MRRLQLAARARHASGLDRVEAKRPLVVRERAAITAKVFFERFFLLVFGMRVTAQAVGLPDFDRRIVDWLGIGLDHPAPDRDALAGDTLGRHVLDLHPLEADPQVRTDGLGSTGAQAHRRTSIFVSSRPRSTTSNR